MIHLQHLASPGNFELIIFDCVKATDIGACSQMTLENIKFMAGIAAGCHPKVYLIILSVICKAGRCSADS